MPLCDKFPIPKTDAKIYKALKNTGQITSTGSYKISLKFNEQGDRIAVKYLTPRNYGLSLNKILTATLTCYFLRLDEWALYFFLYAKYWCNMHGNLFGF